MTTHSMKRDDGFSIAEVVIASAILFFVITAMVGLVGASQTMSVAAKQRTLVTNAMAQYVDHIRAMDYEQLAMPPSGELPPSETIAVGDYTVTFTNYITYPDGQDGKVFKTVRVGATSTMNGHTYTTSAVVNVKNPANDTTAESVVNPDAPVIEFTSPTPDAYKVLFGKWVHPEGTTARIAVSARSPKYQIVKVEYKVGAGVPLRDSVGGSGSDAIFNFTPGVTQATPQSDWDTEQVADGFQSVVVIATDDQGNTSTAERKFIVDNSAPATSGVPVGFSSTSTQGRLDFKAAVDGEHQSYASRYMYYLYKEPYPTTTGSWSVVASGTVAAGATPVAAVSNAGTITADVSTAPFSRYWASIRAGSPRDFNWNQISEMNTPFLTKPEIVSSTTASSTCLTKSVTKGAKRVDYGLTLWVTKPQFAVDNAAVPIGVKTSYVFQMKDSSAAIPVWTPFDPKIQTSAGYYFVVTEVGEYRKIQLTYYDANTTTGLAKPLYFRVGVKVKPNGWRADGSTQTLFSNAVGIAPADPNGEDAVGVLGQLLPTWSM